MDPFTYNYRYIELHLCELRAQAERERLVRRANRVRPLPRPRHWRRWVSALLITAGEALIGRPVAEAAGPQACVESQCGCLVIVPVADVDRAKAFYLDQLGFRLDVDHQAGEDLRVVQLTPPGSACASTLMGNVEAAGSVQGLHLVVRDSAAARAWLAARGAPVGETVHVAAGEPAIASGVGDDAAIHVVPHDAARCAYDAQLIPPSQDMRALCERESRARARVSL